MHITSQKVALVLSLHATLINEVGLFYDSRIRTGTWTGSRKTSNKP